jgi:hypothetical protein
MIVDVVVVVPSKDMFVNGLDIFRQEKTAFKELHQYMKGMVTVELIVCLYESRTTALHLMS